MGDVVPIRFADFWPGFEPESWAPFRVLRDACGLAISDDAALLICGPYGYTQVWHAGLKVFWTGEPHRYRPSDYDYTVSFDIANRRSHLRFPIFVWYQLADALDGIPGVRPTYAEWKGRARFCNFIYADPRPSERKLFFDALARLRPVAAPGVVRNNEPPVPGGRAVDDWRPRKVNFQQQFRFTIAFENRSQSGYTSEKLIDALAAGTIPIYWGNPDIAIDVDPRAFINASEFASYDELARYVVEVDENEELARSYLDVSQPMQRPTEEWVAELVAFFDEVIRSRPRRPRLRSVGLTLRDAPRLALLHLLRTAAAKVLAVAVRVGLLRR
jgi:Glycosyltransferase family 10 (fucosyltransferase) C-term/Alpha-(1,3)-fucosyltransferase FucT N-terminal domain